MERQMYLAFRGLKLSSLSRNSANFLFIHKTTLTQSSVIHSLQSAHPSQTNNQSIVTAQSVVDNLPNRHIDQPLSENDVVSPHFVNRNPRNLENICVARKPKGWALDLPPRDYWHKVFLEISGRHTNAWVEHYTGFKVVSASTQEWAIKKHLYSTHDISAAENIGHIIARRCLESGILYVHTYFKQDGESEKVSVFKNALVAGGLSLEEPYRIYPLRPWD